MSFRPDQLNPSHIAQRLSQSITQSIVSGCFNDCIFKMEEERLTDEELKCLTICSHKAQQSYEQLNEMQPKK